jgi:hypothetical protein
LRLPIPPPRHESILNINFEPLLSGKSTVFIVQ